LLLLKVMNLKINDALSLWSFFFPKSASGNDFDPNDKLLRVVDLFYTFFGSIEGQKLICEDIDDQSNCSSTSTKRRPSEFIRFDIQQIQATISLPDFVSTLRSKPKEVIGCIGIAISIIIHYRSLRSSSISSSSTSTQQNFLSLPSLEPIYPQLYNLIPAPISIHQFTQFNELNAGTLGQLVNVVGYVVRVSHR
jgi:hypothetical protein